MADESWSLILAVEVLRVLVGAGLLGPAKGPPLINPLEDKRRLINRPIHEIQLREIRFIRFHCFDQLSGAEQSCSKQDRVLSFFRHRVLVDWCAEEGGEQFTWCQNSEFVFALLHYVVHDRNCRAEN